jgi:acyl-CoA synthetase (AMP-forming)/AMP-acid ligase II
MPYCLEHARHNTYILQVDAVTGETTTYADILSTALSIADFLYSRGIRSGDVVGICSENSLDFILPVIGTFFTGATCAPLNPNYTLRKQQQKYLHSFSGWGETESTWYVGHYWPIVPAPDDR